MKFEKRCLKFEFDGNDYKLNYPNVKQILRYQEAVKASSGEEFNYETTFDLLEELGLPKDISEEMEISHIVTIMQTLTKSESEEEKK